VSDALLGVIAAAVVVIAVTQVALFMWATRTARDVRESVRRLEQEVHPILSGLRVVASEGAKAATMASAQVERFDEMLTLLRRQVDRTVRTVQDTVLAPARDAAALLQALRDVFFGGGARGAAGERRRRQPADDDDALFIG
jgi:ABC-type multidrug transport system fused ATPase/permease subunit